MARVSICRPLPQQGEAHFLLAGQGGQHAGRVAGAREACAVEGQQDIARPHAGAGRRRAAIDARHQRAGLSFEAQRRGQLRRQFLQFQAQPAARYFAVFAQLAAIWRTRLTGTAKPMPSEPPLRL